MRFDKNVRLFGSVLFTIGLVRLNSSYCFCDFKSRSVYRFSSKFLDYLASCCHLHSCFSF